MAVEALQTQVSLILEKYYKNVIFPCDRLFLRLDQICQTLT